MKKGEKSKIDGIENFLCPFTDMYITQGAGEGTHRGTMGVDVRGKVSGTRYAYYSPCTLKCIKTYPESGQVMWQSTKAVRCPNGYIGIVTLMTAHDDSMNAYPGLVVPQGNKLGNMGTKGKFTTGVHCHIECSQGSDTSWYKNKYGIYMFNNEKDLDSMCYFDHTNIMNRKEYLKPVYTSSIKVENEGKNYVNLPPHIDTWRVYRVKDTPVKRNSIGLLRPSKFKGLSYYIYSYLDHGNTCEIQTRDYGRCKIYIKDTPAVITMGYYKY